MQKEIMIQPILKYDDFSRPLSLQTNESLKGLGAVSLQEGHQSILTAKVSRHITKHVF